MQNYDVTFFSYPSSKHAESSANDLHEIARRDALICDESRIYKARSRSSTKVFTNLTKMPTSKYQHINPAQHQTILRLASQGLPQASIASALSISKMTVSRHIRNDMVRHSEVPKKRPDSEEYDDLVQTAYQRQMIRNMRWASNREICDNLEISKTRLQKLYKMEDLKKGSLAESHF